MSVAATSSAWSYSHTKGGTLLVLLAICDHCDQDGYAFPYEETLAEKSRLSVRQVRRAISELEEAGEIQVWKFKVNGKGPKRNGYQLLIGPFAGMRDVEPDHADRFGKTTKATKRVPAKVRDAMLEGGRCASCDSYERLNVVEIGTDEGAAEPRLVVLCRACQHAQSTGQNVRYVEGGYRTSATEVPDMDVRSRARGSLSEPSITVSGANAPLGADPSEQVVPKKARARNVVWDAVVEEWGHDPFVVSLTAAEKGRVAKAVSQISAAVKEGGVTDANVIAHEVHMRAAEYRGRWPGRDLTPQALAANWSTLALPRPNGSKTTPDVIDRMADQIDLEAVKERIG